MNSPNIDYKRLSYLGDRVRARTASKQERDEFMLMLYRNHSITEKQYNDYQSNQNVEEIVKAGLAVGVIILIGYLLKELFPSK